MIMKYTSGNSQKMVRISCGLIAVLVPWGVASAQTEKPTQAAPTINIRTAGDLASACSVKPANRTDFARLNFCTGYAQGVLDTDRLNPNPTKFCFPKAPPKRAETMKEFATWVGADAARKNEMANVAFLKFMGGRFPCK